MTRFRWGVATDIGRTRSVNQDSAYAAEGFYAVADGMGGHQGGEIASAVAIDTLTAALPVVSTDDVLTAIHAANRAVLDRARDDPSLRGMGTTLCVLALVSPDGPDVEGVDVVEDEPLLVLANVGDSRAYQFAGGVLEQMTDDHSMVGEMVRQGRLSAAEAETHPQRNILTRALGIDHRTQIDAWHVRPVAGDRWLLCSDGLFNEVPERTIADVLAAIDDPAVAARHLVQLANENGGRDNITVVIADVLADEGHATPAPLGALQEGELASARRRVPHEPPAELGAPTAPTGGAGRAEVGAVADEDREPAAEPARAPGRPVAPPAGAGAAGDRPGLVGRARAGWRVVAFGAAFVAVVVIAVGAWATLRDGTSVDGPPVPVTSTAATSSTSSTTTTTTTTTTNTTTTTTGVTATSTTTVPPASPGSTPG
jgi:serine/threonine protein phosphatase PrpC